MNSSRHNRFAAVLGVVALLLQLILPTLHAQSWAKQNGDPLLYAFCGEVNPALVKQLLKTAPPELLKKLKANHQDPAKLSCPSCLSVHASQAPGTFAHAIAPTRLAGSLALSAAAPSPPQAQLVRPPSRAPPSIS